MELKKLVSLVVSASIFASLASVGFSVNAEEAASPNYENRPVYTREYNVAQNKPVTTSGDSCFNQGNDKVKSLSSAVDDDWKTEVVTEYGTNGVTEDDHWLMVDLQKRYVINSVQIAARYGSNAAGWQSGYEIQASNDSTFATYDVLDTIAANNALTSNLNAATGNINQYKGSANGKAYRYVRLFAAKHCIGISELKVFANQTVTDISTGNKTAVGTRTANDLQTAKALFSDLYSWNGGEAGYPWMRVDLGAAYPVGAIELEVNDNSDARRRDYMAIYGSNVESAVKTDEKSPFAEGALTNKSPDELYNNNADYTKLTDINGNVAYANGYQEYPVMKADGSSFMKASVQDTTSFRYITYKRTNNTGSRPTSAKNMRIMVINPVVNSVKASGGKITLEFNDKMSGITADNITVKKGDITYAIKDLTTNDYEVSFTAENAPSWESLTVMVDKAVKNVYGVPMASEYTGSVVLGVDTNATYEGRTSYTREYNVAQNKPVTTSHDSEPDHFLANCNDQTIKSIKSVVDDDWKTEIGTEYGTNGATDHDHWLMVDLQKRYVINSVQIAARYGSNAAGWQSGYEIQASNDSTFATYDVLDTIAANNALTSNLNAATGNINQYKGSANGKAYRYVRLFAAKHCIGISELKVFANQTVTDISTGNKTAVGTRTANDLQTAKALFSDLYSWNGGEAGYPWMRVDLGAAYPVGAIELEVNDNSDARRRDYMAIYGSNVESAVKTDEKSPFAEGALTNKSPDELYNNNADYTKLTDINGNVAYANGYQEYPVMKADGSSFMKASVQDTTSFRYITYKRTNNTGSRPTSAKNMRIMVINPVVNSVKASGGKITLEFNDKMSGITADNITVKKGDTTYAVKDLTTNDYEVSFTAENAPSWESLTVTVDKAIKNVYGVPMASEYTGSVVIGEGINATEFKFGKGSYAASETATASASVQSAVEGTTPVILFVAVKDAEGMLRGADFYEVAVSAGSGTTSLSKSIAIPSEWTTGWTVEAYLWNKSTLYPYIEKIAVDQ